MNTLSEVPKAPAGQPADFSETPDCNAVTGALRSRVPFLFLSMLHNCLQETDSHHDCAPLKKPDKEVPS